MSSGSFKDDICKLCLQIICIKRSWHWITDNGWRAIKPNQILGHKSKDGNNKFCLNNTPNRNKEYQGEFDDILLWVCHVVYKKNTIETEIRLYHPFSQERLPHSQ